MEKDSKALEPGDDVKKTAKAETEHCEKAPKDATAGETGSSSEMTETGSGTGEKKKEGKWKNGKRELTEDDDGVEEVLPTSWPWWKRWWIISVIFLVQMR